MCKQLCKFLLTRICALPMEDVPADRSDAGSLLQLAVGRSNVAITVGGPLHPLAVGWWKGAINSSGSIQATSKAVAHSSDSIHTTLEMLSV